MSSMGTTESLAELPRHQRPWKNVTQSFSLAISPTNIILGALGFLLLAIGEWAFARLPFGPYAAFETAPANQMFPWPWDILSMIWDQIGDVGNGIRTNPLGFLAGVFGALGTILLAPLIGVVAALSGLAKSGSFGEFAWYGLMFAWAIVIWSVIGGAITRRAALRFANHDSPGLTGSLRFSVKRFKSFSLSAGLPLILLGILWGLIFIGSLVGNIPFVGPWMVGIFWLLPLLLGFVMALLVVGLALGWPLMNPSVSVEDVDYFDGFSRSFGMAFHRPASYLWQWLVALLVGVIGLFVVGLFCKLSAMLAGSAGAAGMFVDRPELMSQIGGIGEEPDSSIYGIVQFWLKAMGIVIGGFVASYFWSAATIIYLALRYEEDRTDMFEVTILDAEPAWDAPQTGDAPPTVGMAGTELPIVERPAGEIPPESETPPEGDPPAEESSEPPAEDQSDADSGGDAPADGDSEEKSEGDG